MNRRRTVGAEALWFVEAHLGDDAQVETVADVVRVSRFHLSRAFLAEFGEPLSSYVRARRLSEAAKRLAAGAEDILSVALAVGYGSHEAFTRAFARHFGLTPEEARARRSTEGLPLRAPRQFAWWQADGGSSREIEMGTCAELGVPTKGAVTMETLKKPVKAKREEFTVFGLGRTYACNEPNGMAGIPSQWAEAAVHFGGIEGEVPGAAYGIVLDGTKEGTITYVVGVEVRGDPSEPKEFSRFTIPAQTYAVWKHEGHIAGIQKTWATIWGSALRDEGLRASRGPVLETYGKDFDAHTGQGTVELWVPIAE